jgi:hypothetical protein
LWRTGVALTDGSRSGTSYTWENSTGDRKRLGARKSKQSPKTQGSRSKWHSTLKEIAERKRPLKRDALRQRLGATQKEAGLDKRFVTVEV